MQGKPGTEGTQNRVFISARQREVLILAAEGLTDCESAKRLGLAVGTVRNYLAKARRRLGARNTTQAVAVGIRQGLIE